MLLTFLNLISGENGCLFATGIGAKQPCLQHGLGGEVGGDEFLKPYFERILLSG